MIEYVLGNPKQFPGKHNFAHERTSQVQPPLQPVRQMELVWDCLKRNIRNVLESGKSVHIEHFGTFTFEPIIAPHGNHRNPREANMTFRPCFFATKDLAATLPKYLGKKQVLATGGSIYQQGIRMTYLNSHTIATEAHLNPAVVKDAITALFKGIVSLCQREYNVDLHFGFASILLRGGNLKPHFKADFVSSAQKLPREWPVASVTNPVPAPRSYTEGELASLSDLWNKEPVLPLNTLGIERLPEWRKLTKKLGTNSMDLTSTS